MFINVNFSGGLADAHRLPAYDGAKSLEGITRSLLIVTNFLVEGRVRHREFGRVPLTFNIVAQQPGSFETVFEIAYTAAVIGGPVIQEVAGSVASNLLTELISTTFKRATGLTEERPSAEIIDLEATRSGDVDAIVDAIEPALRQSHTVINHGVTNITIHNYAQPEQPVARLNRETKGYMWDNVIDDRVRVKLFSVASFNANQGTGRAFDLEEGRSIPFKLAPDTDRQTVDTLLGSISSYTRRRRLGDNLTSAIALVYTCVLAVDGRVKKITIQRARNDISQLG
ncbi:hypothetical protein [Agrobacterium tumefaciens]|uniref:Uncharacterized protein n=1 Tax=Agrobacterium tumefaciens TaxID=358 RepID=A0A176XF04_AGRTU|nr:hypothetical protein [Agrobacterium tumefaciens]OAE47858.1 hypothetical protein A7J57_06425 [Agrobacterium tumefaciens]